MRLHRSRRWLVVALALAFGLLKAPGAPGGEPILPGYSDYQTLQRQLQSIAGSKLATLKSLGKTLGGREVYVLEIGCGDRDARPAILIVGGVHAPHLVGSELAVRLARRLVEQAQADKAVEQMLQRVTFYVIPRASPDPCEAFFRRPYVEVAGNERKTDDDRDGEVDEDGPEDLNGDGLITMMRVEDPAGPYMPHPRDARVMVRADRQRGERGQWSLYAEGRDNDGDEQLNEDPPGGTELNRNFTFRYPYFQRGAGPHQMSEVETRAVADFAFSHANIFAVLTFTPDDNLLKPWKPDPASESQRAKTAVLSGDAGYLGYVAEQYRQIHGGAGPPDPPEARGALSTWAYFHYGRWSFACRGWWIPLTESPSGGKAAKGDAKPPAPQSGNQPAPGKPPGSNGAAPPAEKKAEAKPAAEMGAAKRAARKDSAPARAAEPSAAEQKAAEAKRASEDLGVLRWLAEKKIDGFVDWQRIEHPDFPGRKVEVGGFKPFVRLNPPAAELESLAEKHWRFLRRLVELLPAVAIHESKVESLGGGVWRVTATVINRGTLPTMPEMGRVSGEPQGLQAAIEIPQGARLVTGTLRVPLAPLAGSGGKAEPKWLVSVPQDKPAAVRLRVWSPSVGEATAEIPLTARQKGKGRKP